MLETVTENTKVKVGQFYMVRCAIINNGYDDSFYCHTPIIGPEHKDSQLGVSFPHYHVDGRFARANDDYRVDRQGRSNSIVRVGKGEPWVEYCSGIILLKRKCLRLTTGINPPAGAIKYWGWYRSMVGKSCAGRKCPHLGHPMQEIKGVLVCPLHGLRGHLETETIIAPF